MNYSWSYSAFSTAVTCLQKFKLCYVDKVNADYDSGDMAFGSALHSALNSALCGEGSRDVFEVYWDSFKDKPLVYSRFKWEELKGIGIKFLNTFERKYAKKYEIEKAEVRLYGDYQGIKLEGTMDFYGRFDGKRSLRDFKTSGYNYPKEKKDIALQINLYTYLAKVNGLEYPETLAYDVFSKGTGTIQQLEWDFSEKVMFEHLDNLVEYCKMFDKQDIYPKNPGACLIGKNKCQYWSRCNGDRS